METLSKVIKICFILCASLVLYLLVASPLTDCQACEIEYKGEIIDGYEAFDVFADGCLEYDTPWDSTELPNINQTGEKEFFYVDIDDINSTYDENGTQIIEFMMS